MQRRRYKGISRQRERQLLAELRADAQSQMPALLASIDVTYPEIKKELLWNIALGYSYESIEYIQGYVPLNRADFYGCRRKVLAIFNRIGRR